MQFDWPAEVEKVLAAHEAHARLAPNVHVDATWEPAGHVEAAEHAVHAFVPVLPPSHHVFTPQAEQTVFALTVQEPGGKLAT